MKRLMLIAVMAIVSTGLFAGEEKKELNLDPELCQSQTATVNICCSNGSQITIAHITVCYVCATGEVTNVSTHLTGNVCSSSTSVSTLDLETAISIEP